MIFIYSVCEAVQPFSSVTVSVTLFKPVMISLIIFLHVLAVLWPIIAVIIIIVWAIQHNYNKFPSITTVDSSGNVVIGDIFYNDSNLITVTFSAAFSGVAYLN